MATVVSDTSVLHYLSVTRHFACLSGLFGKVIIPPGVWKEVSRHPELAVHASTAGAIAEGWIAVKSPHDQRAVQLLLHSLGAGESEAIVLANESKPSLLLMDDLDGRRAAHKLNLPVMGTVGILVRARQQGLIAHLKPVLDELIATHRFRFSKALCAEALRKVDETD